MRRADRPADSRHIIPKRADGLSSVVPSGVVAQYLGASVVLTGAARISVMAGGKPNSFGVRFTDVYQNQNGTWRMVTWQSTKLPE